MKNISLDWNSIIDSSFTFKELIKLKKLYLSGSKYFQSAIHIILHFEVKRPTISVNWD